MEHRPTIGVPPGYLWARAGVSFRDVSEFANWTDEELRQYVYGNKLDS
jgi:hypothetical protein